MKTLKTISIIRILGITLLGWIALGFISTQVLAACPPLVKSNSAGTLIQTKIHFQYNQAISNATLTGTTAVNGMINGVMKIGVKNIKIVGLASTSGLSGCKFEFQTINSSLIDQMSFSGAILKTSTNESFFAGTYTKTVRQINPLTGGFIFIQRGPLPFYGQTLEIPLSG